jgi:hypothetical protein
MSPKRVLIGAAIFASALPAAAQSESTSTWSLWSRRAPTAGLAATPEPLRLDLELAPLASQSFRYKTAAPAPLSPLNLSLVGRGNLTPSLTLYGRLGLSYARYDLPAPTGAEQGYGWNYSAGLDWTMSRRVSASFGVESQDLRFGASRDPMFTGRLGVRWP